ncbi:DeoR/GlpR family DNA-binding transcription regulator [Aliiruegeria lutimaris]|uniref:Transcriptional regulator, DeoR family n=1 Tax=Aliiruegeria lutimaris TaxID=571298 RepID=A0A1G9FFD7_9RHOB|nr:DeoR/GlpR family DNA-binding transcription regulator [Aliiruegeria lutimaris]SDK87067.1 transcriptional regulator, DeoR family [Aliiruegeria lutimaris]
MKDTFDLAGVRRRKIAKLVEERGSVGVRDLSEEFGVSNVTIRRDLKELGQMGVVTRTHGGVMINSAIMADVSNEERKSVGHAEKARIGKVAIEMLSGDEVVYLDAGTTALAIAAYAHLKPDCHYVTTCLGIANQLMEQDIRHFYLIGGSYRDTNDSFTGTLAIAALRSLSFDVAFLCCSAIDIARRSISIADEIYSQIQKEAIASSRRNVVVAHHGKVSANGFVHTAGFDQLNCIITDTGLDEDSHVQLKGANIEVILA